MIWIAKLKEKIFSMYDQFFLQEDSKSQSLYEEILAKSQKLDDEMIQWKEQNHLM